MERSRMNLRKGPDTLCFDKDEFMKEDFDVDHFVSDCRKRVQLEELRDDLELYYKLLKTAMVELINKDYADFVNLSTNLVGMDKALNQLSVPLGQLREEVLSLRSSVSEGIRAVDERMSKQEDIRRKKMCVLRLIQVIRSVEKIEKILNSPSSKDTSALEASSPLLTGQILERIATEFNQLQFHAVQSKGMPLLDKVRPFSEQFHQSLLSHHVLTAYRRHHSHAAALAGRAPAGRPAHLRRGHRPALPAHLRHHRQDARRRGLSGPGAREAVRGRGDCRALCRGPSQWPPDHVHETAGVCSSPLPPSSGSHGRRHLEKYTVSMDFVRRFERQCGSQASVQRLRAHPAYHSFNNKWNLPVYFQIRFREIAGSLEAALTDVLEDAPAESPYCLLASHRTWSSLRRCWSDELFVPSLAHRLWRLTLQVLARFSVFVGELLLRPVSNESARESKKPQVTGNRDPSLTQGNAEDPGRGLSEAKPVASISSTRLVHVFADLDRMQEQLPELLETIRAKLEMIDFRNFSSISAALEDSQRSLSACMPAVSSKIIQELSESCFSYLKGALEVPRLYRRTNKEVPTSASSYVDSALKPLHQLQREHKDKLKQEVLQQWLQGALSESTHKYYETVSDVLSSVKKMEESLKRLKQARKANPNPVGPSGGMSDDDKIRLQLALDVGHLGEEIQRMGLHTGDVRSFPALAELVLAAKDQATAEQP
ncbi:conserved oligomeric Golgi complex subunit 2 isoform X4 [Tupaia chinensis]|uniref:conserved oligomeric Golgi complex subunit 2 isoform X4 n=1 Tax=Tupaia chinensis TaxID=246437 RepID=UPI000FFC4E82|nr:conserved oligomeric Golgi complex subunit 2 isoform X4 [Tupaia chinensis]